MSIAFASPDFSNGFDGLIDYLRDPRSRGAALSPQRFIAALGIDQRTLANQAGVHRNTLSRAPESECVQRYLREILRVLRVAYDACGDILGAIFWYRNEPLAGFQYRTAEKIVADGNGDALVSQIVRAETQVVHVLSRACNGWAMPARHASGPHD